MLLAFGTCLLNLWDILPEKSVFVYLETWATPNNLIYDGDLGLCGLRLTPPGGLETKGQAHWQLTLDVQ